jgi:porphobilinogen deaminase
MTPQLNAAIAAIQPLSPTERQQLLQILTQSDGVSDPQTDLKALNVQFWQGISLQQLRATQTPTTIHSLKDLAADFWPVEDSIEDFLLFLRQQRQEVI